MKKVLHTRLKKAQNESLVGRDMMKTKNIEVLVKCKYEKGNIV